jgi:4-amino-4-deoxy-L-arabinose transferase-like glycosyltransferase
MTFILFALRQALVLGLLACTAWSAGTLATGLLLRGRPQAHLRRREDTAPWPITMAMGLAILAQVALLLGFLGWLRAPIVATMAIGLNVAAAAAWRRTAMDAARVLAGMRRKDIATCAVVAALGGPPFLLALYPPLGFDQTLYHLPFARAFAASGGLPFLPALRFPVFPQLAEALNAAVLLFADDVSTQMPGWLALVACAGLVFLWAREQSSAAGGWLAAAMLVGNPIVVYLAATGYVDPLLALLGVGSCYAALRARQRMDDIDLVGPVEPVGRVDNVDGVGWLVIAGLLAGSAAGVKYHGLYFVPATALLFVRPRRDDWRTMMRALVWYGVAAFAALAPTYGRIVALTGNPVFPFYPELFGTSPWAIEEHLGPRGLARFVGVSTFFFDITFRRHTVGGLPFWSPVFLVGAPLAMLGAWRQPSLRPLLLIAVGYMLVAPIYAHYFLAIAPLWCIVIAVAAVRLVDSWPTGQRERLLLAATLAIALGGDAYTFYRVRTLGLPPATPAGREQLLSAHLPLYPAIAFLNRTAGPVRVYVVNAEHMVDYVAGTHLGDHNGPASYARVAERARTLGSLAAALDEVRASRLIVPNHASPWTEQTATDPRLSRIYGDDHATLYRVLPAPKP